MLVLAFALGTTAACSGVPDRRADADQVAAALRALPGIDSGADSVRGDYRNGMTEGVAYNVIVQLRPQVSADEAATIAGTYFSRADVLANHSLRLTLLLGESRLTIRGKAKADHSSVESTARRWYKLVQDLGFVASWDTPAGTADARDLDLIEVTVPDYSRGLGRIAAMATDLVGRRWIVNSGHNRLDLSGLYGTFPDPAAVALIAAMTRDPARIWNIEYRSGAPRLIFAVWASSADPVVVEREARADLAPLHEFGEPIDYRLKVPGNAAIEVAVRGCAPDAVGLARTLAAEFGSC